MGANATLATFVTGTVASSATMNNNLANINTSPFFIFAQGSLTAIASVPGNSSVPTNFTNPLGVLPSTGWGCGDAGASNWTCWDANSSSASIVNIVPANSTTHWSVLFWK